MCEQEPDLCLKRQGRAFVFSLYSRFCKEEKKIMQRSGVFVGIIDAQEGRVNDVLQKRRFFKKDPVNKEKEEESI